MIKGIRKENHGLRRKRKEWPERKRKQGQKGENDGKGERLMARGERKHGERDGQGKKESEIEMAEGRGSQQGRKRKHEGESVGSRERA
jgi:hypothetical protein